MNNQQQINEHNAIADVAKFNVNFINCLCQQKCDCIDEPGLLYTVYNTIQRKSQLCMRHFEGEVNGIRNETFTYYTECIDGLGYDEKILRITHYFEDETINKIKNIYIEWNNNAKYNNENILNFVNILRNLIDALCE